LIGAGAGLDAGERDLFAHELPRASDWLLGCADRAAVLAACSLGWPDRIVDTSPNRGSAKFELGSGLMSSDCQVAREPRRGLPRVPAPRQGRRIIRCLQCSYGRIILVV
jgi:hypothetical protein